MYFIDQNFQKVGIIVSEENFPKSRFLSTFLIFYRFLRDSRDPSLKIRLVPFFRNSLPFLFVFIFFDLFSSALTVTFVTILSNILAAIPLLSTLGNIIAAVVVEGSRPNLLRKLLDFSISDMMPYSAFICKLGHNELHTLSYWPIKKYLW